MASDPKEPRKEAPKRRIRFGRIMFALVLLGLVAGGVYFASWLNSRRYFLIVDKTEARVAMGRMLPVGHRPYVPADPALRRAYEPIPLPGGMKLPRGTTTFTDRVELDQALYRLLKDATEFTLAADNKRTPELTERYLTQIKGLAGITVQQQLEISKLERDVQYVRARGLLENAKKDLERAAQLFRRSARGGGGRYADGDVQGRMIDAAVRALEAPGAPTRGTANDRPQVRRPVVTSTVTTSTRS